MKKSIMWCSDSPDIPTGYTNQTIYILRALSQYYNTVLLGHQYQGNEKQVSTQAGLEPFSIIPGNYEGGTIDYYVNRIKPQLIAWLCDPFMIEWLPDRKKNWMKNGNPKTLFYFPVDSDDIYVNMEKTLASVDYRVAMSKFGALKLKKETGLNSFIIPHATNPNIFYPLTQEEKERLKKDNNLEGKFVVGMVGRNQSRKCPQRLMYALKEFADNHKDVIGFWHTDPNDPQQVSGGKINTTLLAKQMGLNDHDPPQTNCDNCRLRFTGFPFFSGVPQNTLNMIYNLFDVHAMSTTGEGFGITTLEAMACGIPNILTDYTTTQEIIVENGRCGEPVKWKTFINGGYYTKRVMVDHDDFVKKLEKLYNNPELRKEYGRVGREKVMKYYSLDVIMPQWVQIIDKILNKEEITCQV